MLKHTATIIIFSTVFIFTLFIGFMGIKTGSKSFGSSTIGIPAVIATSSTIVVGIQQNKTLFTVNPYCSSRIITTTGNPIMLSFDTNITPSATVGHFQATSTTVAYDSGLYGCSDVKAYGVNASTTITITETR